VLELGLTSSNKELVIREATLEDVGEIISSSRAASSHALSQSTNEVDEEEIQFWISDLRSLVIVGCLDSRLVAYAYGFCVSPKWFFFDALVVVARARGRGIGKHMYAYLREACRMRRVDLIQGLVKDGDPERLAYWLDRGFGQGSKCIWVEDWVNGG
jgi:GNAT superfamily N-acetyltransferase